MKSVKNLERMLDRFDKVSIDTGLEDRASFDLVLNRFFGSKSKGNVTDLLTDFREWTGELMEKRRQNVAILFVRIKEDLEDMVAAARYLFDDDRGYKLVGKGLSDMILAWDALKNEVLHRHGVTDGYDDTIDDYISDMFIQKYGLDYEEKEESGELDAYELQAARERYWDAYMDQQYKAMSEKLALVRKGLDSVLKGMNKTARKYRG